MTASVFSKPEIEAAGERKQLLAQRQRLQAERNHRIGQAREAQRLGLDFQAGVHAQGVEQADSQIARVDQLLGTASPGLRRDPRAKRRAVSLAGSVHGRDRNVVVGRGVVANPYNANERVEVAVNRRVDVLSQERAHGRISEAAFQVGRMIQNVYERGSGARLGSPDWNGSGSRDQTIAHELAIIFAVDDAKRARAFGDKMAEAIGGVGVRFLRAILTEGQTFATYAARTGRGSGEAAASEIAKRFRWQLEALTEAQHTATGAEGQRIRGVRDPA